MAINVRALANAAIQVVNPDRPAEYIAFTGYTIGEGRKQIPEYAPPVPCMAQVQALSQSTIDHNDAINQSGASHEVYVHWQMSSVSRPRQNGGDIIRIAGYEWLVIEVPESWPQWCKCIVRLQNAQP